MTNVVSCRSNYRPICCSIHMEHGFACNLHCYPSVMVPLFLSTFVKFRMCTPNERVKEVNGECPKCRRDVHECRIALLHPGEIPEDATNEKRAPSFEQIDHGRCSQV